MPKRKSNNDPFGFGNFGLGNIGSTNLDFDIFGSKNSETRKKTRSALNIGMNREWGKVTENIDVMDHVARGYKVERTGKGSDFRVGRPGTRAWKEIEVKSGDSIESPLQKKERKKRGRGYSVHRYGSNPFRL